MNNHIIVGAIVIGDTKKSPTLKSMIENKIELDEVDLSNPSIDEILKKYKKSNNKEV